MSKTLNGAKILNDFIFDTPEGCMSMWEAVLKKQVLLAILNGLKRGEVYGCFRLNQYEYILVIRYH